ncbi:uncharacterized protein PAC_14117 [Phialocephala subalpina]|uniref:Uncharacterized protein n=1 Tax=Phialocephala subalpina TaxID=576137 RepID=A0A1L7XGP4_9HELO|nr:uncharacterized protein PAC_14117 [Phialocephala subalpina]
MQSRLYFSRLGEPFLHKTLLISRPRSFRPFKLRHVPTNTLRQSHSSRPRIANSDFAEPSCTRKVRMPRQHYENVKSSRHATITPTEALATYLDIQDDSERSVFWKATRHKLRWDNLPTILLHYLHFSQLPEDHWDSHDKEAYRIASIALSDRGLSFTDVEDWATIVLEESADERVNVFLTTLTRYPSFLLLEICRTDVLQVGTLKKLLVHIWQRVLHKSSLGFDLTVNASGNPTAQGHSSLESSFGFSGSPIPLHDLEENAFSILIHRLLYQCRRIWPPAVVTVAHMIGPYIDTLPIACVDDVRTPRPAHYRRMCRLQNNLLQALALPAVYEPFESTIYSWSAQKVILALSSTFSPPLILDQPAYQAVVQVLAASKKSAFESRSATLRTRTWPPWRVEQDGMDAQRELEEDLSRSIAALMRKRESGYSDVSFDMIMSILGGQEPDGTPTIQTRAFVKNRPLVSYVMSQDPLNPSIWAARIEATRDVQEAWAAFTEHSEQGGKPSLIMYHAMFRKLVYERRRRSTGYVYNGAPGDGREVQPVIDDNISDFYRSRLRPPSYNELYENMLRQGLRPSGLCLNFLVRHAPSIREGIRYLHDSGLSAHALRYLHGGDTENAPSNEVKSMVSQDMMQVVEPWIIGGFVALLCRFAPRAVLVPKENMWERHRQPSSKSDKVWAVREVMKGRRQKDLQGQRPHPVFAQPLQHAAFLLEASKQKHRPAWHALWKALSQPNLVLIPKLSGNPKNVEIAWRVSAAALKEFHRIGLELDPLGFKHICETFTKYAKLFTKVSQRQEGNPPKASKIVQVLAASKVIKAEFKKLIVCNNPSPFHLPRFNHSIRGVHLHAYIRSIAAIDNYDEIIFALEWMVDNHVEFDAIAERNSREGRHLLLTLIAIRIAVEGTVFEGRAWSLVDSVVTWDGWPTDDEVAKYKMQYETDYVTEKLEQEEASKFKAEGDNRDVIFEGDIIDGAEPEQNDTKKETKAPYRFASRNLFNSG